jgi:hypothetical protein
MIEDSYVIGKNATIIILKVGWRDDGDGGGSNSSCVG